jgi:hypothetical protein
MKATHQHSEEVKQTLLNAVVEFGSLAEKIGRHDLVSDIGEIRSSVGRGQFRLVVMGEIKKGKSSFINALLGIGNLLPTDIDIATSTVYKIIHGPERKLKVFFLPDAQTGRQMDPLEISESQLVEYGTESGNPSNRKQVDFIALELPSDLLATGLTIVDTPGVGGLYKSHRGISWRYAPNADAVFFILDSTESVISRDEIAFLRELTDKITQRVYFVQTKTDMPSREQREAWEVRNKEILIRELPHLSKESLRYFPTSSKLKREGEKLRMAKLVEDSGFPDVERFLRDELIAAKDFYLCQGAAKPLLAKVRLLRGEVESEARNAQVEVGHELEALQKDLEKRQREYAEWEQTTFQVQRQEFSDRFRDLRQLACEELQNALDSQYVEFGRFMNTARQTSDMTAELLDSKIREIQEHLIGRCYEDGHTIIGAFTEAVDRILSDFYEKISGHIPENEWVSRSGPLKFKSWTDGVVIQNTLHLNHSEFERTRNVAGGGLLVFGLAAALGNWVVPGLGTLAGLAAGLWGADLANDAMNKRQVEEALLKMDRVLRETLQSVKNRALQDFNRISTERERAIRDLFQAAANGTREQYERQVAQVRERGTQTKEALRESAAVREGVLRKLNELTGQLQSLIQVPYSA